MCGCHDAMPSEGRQGWCSSARDTAQRDRDESGSGRQETSAPTFPDRIAQAGMCPMWICDDMCGYIGACSKYLFLVLRPCSPAMTSCQAAESPKAPACTSTVLEHSDCTHMSLSTHDLDMPHSQG